MAHKKSTSGSAPRKSTKRNTTSHRSTPSTSRSNNKSFLSGLVEELTPTACVIGGIVLASVVDKQFTTPATSAVSGLMGLEGTSVNKFVKPAMVLATGLAIGKLVPQNQYIKNIGFGIAGYGVLNGIEAFSGKKITMSGVEDEVTPKKEIGAIADTNLETAIEKALQTSTEAPKPTVQGLADIAPETVASIASIAPETIADIAPETIADIAPETIASISYIGDDLGDIESAEELNGDGDPIMAY